MNGLTPISAHEEQSMTAWKKKIPIQGVSASTIVDLKASVAQAKQTSSSVGLKRAKPKELLSKKSQEIF